VRGRPESNCGEFAIISGGNSGAVRFGWVDLGWETGRRRGKGKNSFMDIREAGRIGGREAAVACLWVFVLFEAVVFFPGAHGDFLTEGRSFMLSQVQPVLVSAVVVTFVLVYFLGRAAGRQILAMGRSAVSVGLIQWLITMAAVVGYVWGFSWVLGDEVVDGGVMVLLLGLMMAGIWVVVVWLISRAKKNNAWI
jgi:hypothetical protein